MKFSEVLNELKSHSTFCIQINYGTFSSITRGIKIDDLNNMIESTIVIFKESTTLFLPNAAIFEYDKEKNEYRGKYVEVGICIFDIK